MLAISAGSRGVGTDGEREESKKKNLLRKNAVDGWMGGDGAQFRERQRVYCAPTDLELLRLTGGDAH